MSRLYTYEGPLKRVSVPADTQYTVKYKHPSVFLKGIIGVLKLNVVVYFMSFVSNVLLVRAFTLGVCGRVGSDSDITASYNSHTVTPVE